MLKENCYDYTKTELYKLRREELLQILYEQTVFYQESASGHMKNYSKKNTFGKFKEQHKYYSCNDLRESIITL